MSDCIEFSYIGINISINLIFNEKTLFLKLLRINPNHHNGDIFCSGYPFMDYGEKKFGHLEFPIKVSPQKPHIAQYENVSKEVFEQICEAIVYYDKYGESLDDE